MSAVYNIKIGNDDYDNVNGGGTDEKGKILSFSMTKKMYEPCRLNVTLIFTIGEQNYGEIANIKSKFTKGDSVIFSVKKGVSDDSSRNLAIDYCIFGYKFCEKKVKKNTQLDVILYMYSRDHYLTLDKGCMAYTGRYFVGDIFPKDGAGQETKSNNGIGLGNIKGLQDYCKNLKTNYNTNKANLNGKRLPYLVQYNESFYDFICRTANKYGEFLFFEDGALNLGLFNNTTTLEYNNSPEVIIQVEPEGSVSTEVLTSHDTALNMDSYLKEVEYPGSHEWFRTKEKKFDTWLTPVLSTGITLSPNLWVEGIPKGGTLAAKIAFDEKYNADEKWKLHKKANLENYTSDTIKKTYYEGEKYVREFSDISESSQDYWDVGEYIEKNNNKEEDSFTFVEIKIDEDEVYEYCPRLGEKIKYDGQDYAVVQVDLNYSTKDDEHSCAFKAIKPIKEKIDGKDKETYYPAPLSDDNIRVSKPQIGIVSRRDDPLFLGRVRIRFKWQGENSIGDDSPWIPVASPLVSTFGGVKFRPEKGDEVLVDFEKGNVEKPFVSGYLFTTKHHNTAKYVPTKGVVSRNGHSISFIDKDESGFVFWVNTLFPLLGKFSHFMSGTVADFSKNKCKPGNFGGGIIIKDRYNFYRIETSSEKRRIDFMSAFGGIDVNAFTGITINAPNGDIDITGKNVSITAGNNLNIVSGTNAYYAVLPFKPWTKGGHAFVVRYMFATIFEKAVSKFILDMSLYRSMFDIMFRPMQGDLRLKSYRNVYFGAGPKTENLLESNYLKDYYLNIWYTNFCREIAEKYGKKDSVEKWKNQVADMAKDCPDKELGEELAAVVTGAQREGVLDVVPNLTAFKNDSFWDKIKLREVRKLPWNETWGNIYFANEYGIVPVGKEQESLDLTSSKDIKGNFGKIVQGIIKEEEQNLEQGNLHVENREDNNESNSNINESISNIIDD